MLIQKIDSSFEGTTSCSGTAWRCWTGTEAVLENVGTHYGYILDGAATVACAVGEFPVPAGCYFAVPGHARLTGHGQGFLATRVGYEGVFGIGGPVEQRGRLCYIDGCSDSVLVASPKIGDPCLNMLYIPPGIDQTAHTHPSVRVGLVISGQGRCSWPAGSSEMTSGDVFVLPAGMVHSFHTHNEHMRIVVYHPDSDFGPSDDAHPMLNRTLVDGTPANEIPEILSDPADALS